jgi:hypothetical protein
MYSDGATLVINHYCYYYGVVVDDGAGDVGIASSPESETQVGRFSAWTKAPVEKSGPIGGFEDRNPEVMAHVE